MERPSPILLPSRWRTVSSATDFLTRKKSSNIDSEESESDLLKAIRATLRGTRGTSDSAVHTLSYPPDEDHLGDEELTWDTYTVVLSSGGVMRKRWNFEEEGQQVQWACIGLFEQPSSARSSTMRPNHWTKDKQDSGIKRTVDLSERSTFGPFHRTQQDESQENEPAALVHAVYVFLRSMGRIFLSNGLDYTFHLPFLVRMAWPLSPHGVIMQRILEPLEVEEAKLAGDIPLPTIFTLINPFREPAPVGVSDGIICGLDTGPARLKDNNPDRFVNTVPPEEHLLWTSPREQDMKSGFAVSVDPTSRRLSIWRYGFVVPEVGPRPIGRSKLRSSTSKRMSITGIAPAHRRQTLKGAEEGRPSILPPHMGELDPLASLHGRSPSLSTPTPMAAMVGGGSAAGPDWLPSKGRRESLGKHELSVNIDRMVLGGRLDSDSLIGPIDTEKLQPAFWMQRLGGEDLPLEEYGTFTLSYL